MGFIVPRGYDAYARVLHPASLRDDDRTRVRWAQVAAECGTTIHPQAQWHRVAGGRDYDPRGRAAEPARWPGEDPIRGNLEQSDLEALVDVLGRHTATPADTIVGFWVGYGHVPDDWRGLPTARLVPCESHLFRRPLDAVVALCSEALAG